MRYWVAAVVVCAFLTGCGGSAPPTVPTADPTTGPPGPATAPPGSSSPPTEVEQGIRYARCMTAHGVPVPDPVDGAYPHPVWGDGQPVDPAGQRRAFAACHTLFPSVTYARVPLDYVEPYRRYAACMRERGITEGLAEPDDRGVIAATNQIAVTGRHEDPTLSAGYMAASETCDHLLPPSERDGQAGGG
jgi:hypothetical protein